MAILDPNEIFYTAFEPKQQNRFILYVDGIPSYQIKGVGAVSLTQGTVQLNHINVARYVKGKTLWNHTIELSNCHECTKRYKIINLKITDVCDKSRLNKVVNNFTANVISYRRPRFSAANVIRIGVQYYFSQRCSRLSRVRGGLIERLCLVRLIR